MDKEVEVAWRLPEPLQQLAGAGQWEAVAEVLILFQSDTESRLQDLRIAVLRGDRKRVKAQAHALKGSAAQVGASAFAACCQELELNAESRPELDSLLAEIESRFAAASRAIVTELAAVQ